MATIKQLKWRLSKLRQRRYTVEKKCEQNSKMLPASLILRERTKEGGFQKATSGAGKGIFGYLTYLEEGVTRHRYVKKQDMAQVKTLTGNYREFCRRMAEVRSLNREIVRLLDKIGKLQSEEVSNYVKKRAKRINKKKKAK